jgi:hypothetical protein
MSTENSRVNFTEAGTGAAVVTAELNTLADDAAAIAATALSNDASTERKLLANFHRRAGGAGRAREREVPAASGCSSSLR